MDLLVTLQKNKLSIFCIVFVLFLANISTGFSYQSSSMFLNDVVVSAKKILKQDESIQKDQIRTLLVNNVDINFIRRFSVNRYWRKMNENQKTRYNAIFLEYIIKKYSSQMQYLNDTEIQIISEHTLNRNDVIVITVINANSHEYNVKWRIREYKSKYYIIDILVDDVSMLIAQKAEFESVIRAHGIDGFLDVLEDSISKE